MGLCKQSDIGQLDPSMSGAGGQTFALEVPVPAGVLERLDFTTDGTHVTLIGNSGEDGEVDVIQSLRVQIPRVNMPDAEWNWRPRDLKLLNQQLQGTLPSRNITLADGGAFNGRFSIPFVLPDHLAQSPEEYGLDSRDIDGPILVTGRYGVPTDLGTLATVVDMTTDVVACVRDFNRFVEPSVFLVGASQRVAHGETGDLGPTTISTGTIESLYALYLRIMDESAEPDGRTNSLITRFEFRHSFEGILNDGNWQHILRASQEFFGIPSAEVEAGVATMIIAQGAQLEDMPVMSGQTLRLRHNSEAAIQREFAPALVPVLGDHFFANTLGVMLTRAGRGRAAAVQAAR